MVVMGNKMKQYGLTPRDARRVAERVAVPEADCCEAVVRVCDFLQHEHEILVRLNTALSHQTKLGTSS